MDEDQSTETIQESVVSHQPQPESTETKPKAKREVIEHETLTAYIGNNYQKITTRSYNIAAFFFQGCYLLYRRMFLPGILIILAEFTIFGLVGIFSDNHTASWVFTILYVIVGIILCFTFNKFYIAYARKKIAIIRRRNPTVDDAGIRALCAEQRATSASMVFGGILLVFVIMVVINLICYATNIPSPFSTNEQLSVDDSNTITIDIGSSDHGNDSKPAADDYTGSVTYNTSINITDEFSLQVPDQFTDNSSAYLLQYDYSLNQTDTNQCEFTLGALRDFTNAEKLINQMASFNTNSPYQVQTSTINGQNWYWFTNDRGLFGSQYTYVTDKDGTIYLMTYQEPNSDEAPDCAKLRQTMISSLKAS